MFRFPVTSKTLEEFKALQSTMGESFENLRPKVGEKSKYDELVMYVLDGCEATAGHLQEVKRIQEEIEGKKMRAKADLVQLNAMIECKYKDVWAHEKAVVMIRGMIKGLEEDVIKWTLHCEEEEAVNQAYCDKSAEDCEVRMNAYREQLEKAQMACETARKELDYWKTKKIQVLEEIFL